MRGSSTRRVQLLSGACLGAVAAIVPFGEAQAQEASQFRPERFDEDWPEHPGADAPFGARLKNMRVVEGLTLSLGGDARWRFVAQDAPRLGLNGAQPDQWGLQRLLFHADLRFDDDARIFLELGSHESAGRQIPSASDSNSLDVQQAFLDLNTHFADGRATLRIGRQELALGPRFTTARDPGNARQRHDLVRLTVQHGPWRVDLFGGRPVQDTRGSFDDEMDRTQEFFGLRLQHAGAHTTFETYAYALSREDVSLAGVTADDERLSVGARLWGRTGAYDFDAEAMLQMGSFGDQEINAFGVALDLGRRFADAPMRPRPGLRLTYGSGDENPTDATQQTFAPPFANGSWFGQNGLSSFSNSIEAAGTFSFEPAPSVTVHLKAAAVWRAHPDDFLYSGAMPLAGTAGGDDAFVGLAPAMMVIWRVTPNFTISPYVSYLQVSDELAAIGADDVAYAHVAAHFRF